MTMQKKLTKDLEESVLKKNNENSFCHENVFVRIHSSINTFSLKIVWRRFRISGF